MDDSLTVFERVSMRRTLLGVICVAVAYFVVGWAGLLLVIPPGYATAIWPAAGIAVGALIRYGYRLWPGVLLGSFLVNLFTGNDLAALPGPTTGVWVALGIGAGAAAHAVIAACFGRRVLARDPGLVRARSICLLLGLAGPLAGMVSATWGVGMLWAAGAVPPGELAFNWATWWVGDTVGVVLVTPLVLIFLSRQRAAWSRRRVAVTVPLALALVAAIAGYVLASNQELARIKLEFERSAVGLGNNFERQLGRYIETLEALKRHINTSHHIDRASFRTFVSPTLEELPGLLAVGWNPVVAGEELPFFEASARAEGISNFQVRQRNAAGDLVPATPRPVHVAVRYIVPLAGNEAAVGFDVYSNAARRAALDEARDSGRPVATARILLVQEKRKRAGGLVFVPTYTDPEEPETLAERRRALIGYSTGVLRFRDAVAVAVKHLGTGDLDVRVYDDSDSGHDTALVAMRIGADGDSTDLAADAGPGRSGLAWSRRIDFAGRDWRLEVAPGPAYLGGQRSLLPWGVLAAGLAFVSLLGAFLLILTGRAIRDADRADELADLNAALKVSIDEHRRAERALNVEKDRALVTLHSIGDGVITTASDGTIEYLNPVAEALTGWKDLDARGLPLAEVFCIINEETREPAKDPVQRCRSEGRVIGLENHTLLISRSGREHAIQDSAAPIRDRDGRMLGVILVFHDVTETRRMAREAAHYASHDSLTGLVNRREFDRRLEQALASTKEYGSQHALCYLDLDQFKIVNDTSGHRAGDELLKLIASLLGHEVRERDTLARLGGDEFGLLLNNCPMKKAREIAETLVAAVNAFDFAWDGRAFKIGASVGLVSITSDAASAEDLLSQADVACYAAKDAGRNRVHVYRTSDAGPDPSHREILRVGGSARGARRQPLRVAWPADLPHHCRWCRARAPRAVAAHARFGRQADRCERLHPGRGALRVHGSDRPLGGATRHCATAPGYSRALRSRRCRSTFRATR